MARVFVVERGVTLVGVTGAPVSVIVGGTGNATRIRSRAISTAVPAEGDVLALLAGVWTPSAAGAAALAAHIANVANPHVVTKAQVGLGLVENTALSTWAGSANLTALGTVSSGSFPAANLAGTALPAAIVTSSLTTVGTLAALTVVGTVSTTYAVTDPVSAPVMWSASTIYTYTASAPDLAQSAQGASIVASAAPATGVVLSNASALVNLNIGATNAGAGTVTAAVSSAARIRNTSTGTITRAIGYRVLTAVNTGGGTIANIVGVQIAEESVGATANVALQIATSTNAVPAGNWAIHSNSTYPSLLSGRLTVSVATGATTPAATPATFIANSTTSSNTWAVGPANFWGSYAFGSDDITSPPGAGTIRGRLSIHMENTAGSQTGLALWVGPTGGPAVALTLGSDLSVTLAGNVLRGTDRILSTRKTGWTTVPTGTLNRTTFVSDTVTLPELAARVAALIVDLHATAGHGLVGA